MHYTQASVSTSQNEGKLSFEIYHPEQWSFAKISVTNSKDGSTETISTNPGKVSTMNVYENGEYWIQTSLRTEEDSFDAFDVIEVNSVLPGTTKPFDWFGLPEKQIGVIAIVVIVMGLVGLKISRTRQV